MTHRSSAPSQRQLRVGEQLRHIIADTLRSGHFYHESLSDPGRITVTEVRVSPDLKHATVYVTALGGNMDEITPALNEAAPVFQKEIGRQSTMKFTPRVKFLQDESFAQAEKIEEILRDIQEDKN